VARSSEHRNDDSPKLEKITTQHFKWHQKCVSARHSPAYKIANDICMADDNFIAVFELVGISTVDELAERCLNSGAILKNLQTADT